MYDNIDHRPFMTADRESFADIDAIARALNRWWDRVSGPQKQVRHG